MATDRGFHTTLNSEQPKSISVAEGAECLVQIAKKYGVVRTLQKIEPTDVPRLQTAYEQLAKIELPTEDDVVEKVNDFAKALGDTYGNGKIPLSAASKFLWMKFRSPVIIYDTVAADWLKKESGYSYGYSSYHDHWRAKYKEVDQEIKSACMDLIGVRNFTLACQQSDESLSEWIGSEWFRERVFDHYMLNAKTFEQLVHDH